MGVERRFTISILLIISARSVLTQDRCGYMTAIPRPETPILPDLPDFTGVQWSGRPLLPVIEEAPREDVCMDAWIPTSATMGTQLIYMEEEIEGDVSIAKLNLPAQPNMNVDILSVSGSLSMLGAVVRFINNEWHLVITQRQDYENLNMQQYMFNLRVNGQQLVAGVTLLIVNIDDNAPIMQIFDPCSVPELQTRNETDCVYKVYDADGEISTRFMTFSVDSDRGDQDIFYMTPQPIPGDMFHLNMTVNIRQPLNFETNVLHVFTVTASDSLPNNHTLTMMVQVDNVEHRPPRWVEIFAVQQFDEMTTQHFTVRAIDGDTGLTGRINYTLIRAEEDTFFSLETIEGGLDGAILHVDPIDRDKLEREVFQLSIIAYKYANASYSTEANIVIIVNDINNKYPEPLQPEYRIAIMEETPLTLNFTEPFGFHDRDLGENAQYSVRLEDDHHPGAASAFQINPAVGYQRQTFIMSTVNHQLLDYEVPEFQEITIKVIATDMNNTDHVGVAIVHISLINWNDELPIFENSSYSVTFNETVGAGFFVGTVLATDRDINDAVVHSLMGNAGDYLTIDDDTGEIFVSVNDSFDYHRQNVLFVQVRADDTLGEPYNTATTQLVIQLEDVNNTPPTLRLPRGSPSVEENVPQGFVISNELMATDPDTTAHLVFEIDWASSWASKQGRETPSEEYRYCVDINTIYPDPDNLGSAMGVVVAKEIRHNVTIDFEEFEVLYLAVRVKDLYTVLGNDYDESMFTIRIIDMNDNWPVFANSTLEQQLRAREASAAGVVLGSVSAVDIDGPLYNQVRYMIEPREDTPPGLVKIDFYSGQMTVDADGAIDADEPPRHYLYYTVTATDRCFAENETLCPPDDTSWDTKANLTIEIIDTNNKVPQADTHLYNTTVYIYENATDGDEVLQLFASDLDRDEIYHTVSYQINYAVNPRLRVFFAVDLDTGLLHVEYTTTEVLDRDGLEPTHTIFLNLIDNFNTEGDGRRNQNETRVDVILLDVNDNAPEMPSSDTLDWSVSEGLEAGVRLPRDIVAPDRDEPDTDNSRVGYAIRNLTITNRDIEVPELFTMIQIMNVSGELETAMPLRGYWGTYYIHIQAYDHGHPQQFSEVVAYSLVINPYNFHRPEFQFPIQGSTIRLAKERAVANGILATAAGDILERIHATDEDGLHAGTVTFHVQGNEEATEFFEISNTEDNYGNLILLKLFPEDIREFRITIRATDGGTDPGPLWTDSTLTVIFVPTQGDPVFAVNTATVAFFEGEEGLLESFQLPRAEDTKNFACTDDCLSIYYRIIEGNNEGLFSLNATTNHISLAGELDRETATSHTLMVAASNIPDATNTPMQASILVVTINVREANPRPIFESELYTAGISVLDSIGRELLTVRATHSEGAAITYTIEEGSMEADANLAGVRDSAFMLGSSSGLLTLNMQPTAAMHGMFQFNVLATDTAGAYDRSEVKVYLISSVNRVTFLFVNTLAQIEEHRDFIAATLSSGFNMRCNIDQVVPASDEDGVARDDTTEVRAHFIRDNAPVPTTEIHELRSDAALLRSIQMTLSTNMLVLQDLVTAGGSIGAPDHNQNTVYALAGLSAILGFLSLVLLLTFIIRTRALSRRLEALSMTKYGSVDSGLNRAGIAPGTNKHAVEGSNPIWNETIKAPDFDAISDASGDSDLIGIEDMPQFRDDYFPPGDTSSLDNFVNRPDHLDNEPTIATHGNQFGFNTSPFSPEFTNKFRR